MVKATLAEQPFGRPLYQVGIVPEGGAYANLCIFAFVHFDHFDKRVGK